MSGNKMPHNMNPKLYANYGNKSPNVSQQIQVKKERLRVHLTQEERGFFSSLFQIADKEGLGRLVGREAAEFLKRSGLPKEALKVIWIISAQTDNQFLERDEFYIALRLVALAQNNLECSEEAIIKNYPIPPLPKFDLKKSPTGNISSNVSTIINKSLDQVIVPQMSNLSPNQANNIMVISESDPFYMTEVDVLKYTNLFIKNKDMENKTSINKAYNMWTSGGVSTEILKRIFSIVPLVDKTCLNFNEFKVVFHLIYKSLQFDIPTTLPNCLKRVLYSESVNGKNITINPNEINFGDKLGLDLNLSRQKERKENLIEAPQTTTSQQISNNHNLHVNVNKSVDMEALLMNEFNLRNNNNTAGNNNTNNLINHQQNNTLNISSERPLSPNINNIQTINNLSNNMTEKFNILYNEKLAENKFLEQTLEEEARLLKSLREEVEKFYLNISQVEQRNSQMKNMIIEVRRQISIEKDKMSKGIYELNQVTNEMLKTQTVLNDEMNERLEIAKRAVVPNQPAITKTSNDVERPFSPNRQNINNNQSNNFPNPGDSNYNHLNKFKNDLNVDFKNYSPNQPNFNNQNYTNLSKLPEEKLNDEVNHNTGRLNLNVSNNLQNAQVLQNNKPKDFSNPVPVKEIPPIESRNYLEDNVAVNKSGGFVGYPKIEGTPQTYNFDNELDIPAKNTINDPTTNQVNKDKVDNLNKNNNYDTAGFDFNEFGDFKDSFKEFADKKGDDFFKKQSDFQANWDDF